MILSTLALLAAAPAGAFAPDNDWWRDPCILLCERPDQPRSFDVTHVELRAPGGTRGKSATLTLRLRWRGLGPAPTVAVNPYLLDLAGVPLGGGEGQPFSPAAGTVTYSVLLNPSLGLHHNDVGCPRDFGERLIVTLLWNGGKNTEAHLVGYGVPRPPLPCPPNTGRLPK